MKNDLENRFSPTLLKWNKDQNNRQMPWKGESDPYKIWVSEIILQQTRVDQGLQYYLRFIGAFPDLQSLAAAPDERVFKLWEGLGYYTRCRNLIATARMIVSSHNGIFPSNYADIEALKGIGPYTASAIASFAFNLPYAVLDGNVYRVLARVFGIEIAIDSIAGKKLFSLLAQKLLDKDQPGIYNQAIMDFGATVCKPAPACSICPFKKFCIAFQTERISELPVKEKKMRIRKRWFYYLVTERKQKLAIRQRMEKDIWRELYEFPLIESPKELDQRQLLRIARRMGLLAEGHYRVMKFTESFSQQLSHQLIAGRFLHLTVTNEDKTNSDLVWVEKNRVGEYAFPKIIRDYLNSGS